MMDKRFVAIVCLATLVGLSGCNLPISIAKLRKPDLSKYTSPLTSEVVQDICERFGVKDEKPCTQTGTVYAPDFFPIILSSFERGVSTHRDVQAKLGQYEYGCEPPTYVSSLDMTYFRCSYDLNGDRVFPVGMSYDENGVLLQMTATVGDD